jgi:hypothetical protein
MRCLVTLWSEWLAFSLMLTTLSFPAPLQSSVVCDGVDDDPTFEPVCGERDEHWTADLALTSARSAVCHRVSIRGLEIRSPGPLQTSGNLQQAGLRPSYTSEPKAGDGDSVEPH